ncbi:hypothetical protein GYH30_050009 [Glycine max]|nr:hypothetical protein GYH30_050009 [Glycine max]
MGDLVMAATLVEVDIIELVVDVGGARDGLALDPYVITSRVNVHVLVRCRASDSYSHEVLSTPFFRGFLMGVGLGVQTTREINVALLGKHIWSLQHDPHMLWVQLLSNKYLKGNSIFHCSSKPGVSYSWASIVKATNILQLGFRFWVGNGALSLWFDCFYSQGPFCKLVDFVNISDTRVETKDIYNNGSWNWNLLTTSLATSMKDIISSIFLIKSTYKWITRA